MVYSLFLSGLAHFTTSFQYAMMVETREMRRLMLREEVAVREALNKEQLTVKPMEVANDTNCGTDVCEDSLVDDSGSEVREESLVDDSSSEVCDESFVKVDTGDNVRNLVVDDSLGDVQDFFFRHGR